MKKNGIVFFVLAVMLAMAFTAFGDSEGMSYQGMLADINGTVIQDGAYAMRFTIFNTLTGGPAGGLWQESHAAVQTTRGAFAVEFGLATPFGTLFKDEPLLWLEVEVDRNANGYDSSDTYAPRVSLSAAPYVLSAEPYTDEDAVAAMGVKDITNPLHHDRYSDTEAAAAMGAKENTNSLNHDRYTDAEAVAAMGVKDNANPLNHDRFELLDGAVTANKLGDDLKVAFRAHLGVTTLVNAFEPVICDVEKLDTSDSYDPTTGIFTAPYDGFYMFSFAVSTTASFICRFSVNGQPGPGILHYPGQYNHQNSATTVLQLDAGDSVSIINSAYAANLYGEEFSSPAQTHFSGFRIF